MKILIVNRFFGGAQIPTGRMAEDVARLLVEKGHEVTALASSGVYAGAVAQASDQETKRQPEVGGLRSETGDRLHGNQLIKDEKTAAQRSEIGDHRPEVGATRSEVGGQEQEMLRVETVRVPKWMPRALAWLWFTWQARQRIPRMDWDVCVLMTDPPLLPLLAARAASGGWRVTSDESGEAEKRQEDRTTASPKHRAKRRVAVWLMDLYPEALAASGRIGIRNPIYRWYFEKRQQALGSADLLICLGQTQKELLGDGRVERGAWSVEREAKGKEQKAKSGKLTELVRTAVVPPWDDRGNIALATENSLKNLALYAGNLGEAHCFEEILAAAPCLPGDWTIRFAARGAKLAALKAAAGGIRHTADGIRTEAEGPVEYAGPVKLSSDSATSRAEHSAGQGGLKLTDLRLKTAGAVVHVSGYASEEETPGLLASARVHLITMSPGWEGVVVPSKLYGCIRTGRPVLFIGPENADTAREIRAHDWGKVLPPGASGEEVAGAILELAARPTRAPQLQRGAGEIAALLVATAGLQDNGTTGLSGRAL